MEFASLIALRVSKMILRLASAILTEVFGSLWHNILEELHLDPTQGLAAQSDVEENYRIGR